MPAPAFNPRGLAAVDPRTGRPAPPPPRPPAKPPPEDWWHVPGNFLQQFVPSMQKDVGDFVRGATHADLEAGRFLANPKIPFGAKLAAPVVAAMRPGYGGVAYTSPGQKVAAQQAGQLVDRYGSGARARHTLSTDPFGATMDAAMLGAPEEGYIAALRDLAGVPGAGAAAARAALRTARVVNAANPANLAIRGAGAAAGAGARAIRATQAGLDATKPFTPSVAGLIKRNFPKLTDADLARPDFRKAMVTSFKRNGINDAAARQGMLQFHGPNMPTPRGPITQKAPPGPGGKKPGPSPAEKVTDTAITEGKQQLAAKGDQLVGGSAPDPAALGASVRNAENKSAANVNDLYRKADTQPGGITSPGATFTARLRANMANALATAGFSPNAMATLPGLAATNKAAGNLLDAAKGFADAGQISFPDLEQLRRYGIGRDVPGMGAVDPTAAKAMRQAFDQTVQSHFEDGFVTPDTAADAATNYRDARAAHQQHQATYGREADPTIKKATGISDTAATASFPTADDIQATNGINKKLFTGSKNLVQHPDALSTYNAIEAQGPDAKAALDDHIRQTVLGSDNGHLADRPDQVADFVDTPLGQKVFNPDEASDIRMLASGSGVLKPDYPLGQQGPGFWGAVGSGARHVAGAAAPVVAGLAIPPQARALVGPFLDPALAAAGTWAENKFVEPLFAGRGTGRQLAGASPKFNPAPFAEGAMNAVGVGARAADPLLAPGAVAARGVPVPAPAAAAPAPAPAEAGPDPTTPYEDVPIDRQPTAPAPPGTKFDPHGLQPVEPGDAGSAPAAGPADTYEDIPIDKPPRAEHAAGGLVIDMTEKLMKRAEQAQKAARSSTRPLLGLSDDTVAQALKVAQRGI